MAATATAHRTLNDLWVADEKTIGARQFTPPPPTLKTLAEHPADNGPRDLASPAARA